MRFVSALRSLFALVLLSALSFPLPSISTATAGSCAQDSNNLIANGSMADGGSSPWGSVAEQWNAFVMGGDPPEFQHVDNEGIDPEGSQYIFADHPFDAGIYQVVHNLKRGTYYHFWVGEALAAVDMSGGANTRDDEIGRMVGVDPTGGADPHSPNVKWGAEYRDGVRALNIPELSATFAAQADRVTVFVRALNHSSQFRHKVWFDMICMQARNDLPTATPPATDTPTVTPTRVPPTRAPITRTPTDTPEPPTPVPTSTPTATAQTPRPTVAPTDTPKPRRPIPIETPGGSDSGNGILPLAVLFGSVGLIGVSLFGAVVLCGFIAWRVFFHRPASASHYRHHRPHQRAHHYDESE